MKESYWFKRSINIYPLLLPVTAWLLIAAILVQAKIIYVTPTGTSGNSGTSFSSAMDYATALDKAGPGDTVLMQGGTYTVPYSSSVKNTMILSKSGSVGKPISVIAHNNSRAIFNFGWPDNSKVINSSVTSRGVEITGSFWYFRGIFITKAGYQGVYVSGSNITFENCAFYENWNSGLEINSGGSNVMVINCDAYRNFDGAYKKGGMADGFASKQTQGAGNRFVGCRAWENSDDGYDTYDSPEAVILEDCWAFRNGVNVWNFTGFAGNGNGFKIGGNGKLQNNKVTRCIVFGQPQKGFDQNNNTGGLTIYNSLSYANGTNFALNGSLSSGQAHDLKNNISLSGTVSIANATEKNNTWNSGFSVTAADFESIDTSLARVQRNPDGTLPESKLFRLKPTSALVDAGVTVGQPYTGKAPDLGPFESGNPSPIGASAKSTIVRSGLYCSYDAVRRVIQVEFRLMNPGAATITMYDISGKTLMHPLRCAGVRGLNTINIAATQAHHGVCLIHLQKTDGLLCSRLIR